MVFNVPRIDMFSNSAVPLPTESNLKPFTPLTKSFVSILPEELSVKFEPTIVLELKDQPPIVPDVAFKTPPVVTLKGASAKVASPNCIPVSASAINMVSPVPNDINLLLVSKIKLVAVNVLPDIVNPAISPLCAVICPVICAFEAVISENSDLKRQIDLLTVQLENLNKDNEENSNFEDLSTEIANLKAEREEEKKELQMLYDQLSSALAASGEEV